jgi:hypothetical protein
MTTRVLPKYPVYVPSKGRADVCYTARFLVEDRVPFFLVVEKQERDEYAAQFGDERVLVLPFSNRGLFAARNWIKAHAKKAGAERHWQLDDNMNSVRRWHRGKRLPCESGPALRATEDFVDRYTNVAVAGLNYTMFAHQNGKQPRDPFWLNVHVYSCSLILNSMPFKWRTMYNDDTDLCLQVLSAGLCTVSMNAFMVDKRRTMTVKGGNTEELYSGDGRTHMARSLERLWPGVVKVNRRFGRAQHVVKNAWKNFDTPLIRKTDAVISNEPNEYGMKLKQVADEVKSEKLRSMLSNKPQKRKATRCDRGTTNK